MEVVEDIDSKVVLPNDLIATLILQSPEEEGERDRERERERESTVVIGTGIRQDGERLVAAKAGRVHVGSGTGGRTWVESAQKRYIPGMNDAVIGVVVERIGEEYKVDIGSTRLSSLSLLSFDGATRRNRPNLQAGSLVYARVSVAEREMETEITCLSPAGMGRKDWVTGECIYGPLTGGCDFRCSLRLARSLLSPNCPVLQQLGQYFPYEIAVGVNGRVWIRASKPRKIITAMNAIQRSEWMDEQQIKKFVEEIAKRL